MGKPQRGRQREKLDEIRRSIPETQLAEADWSELSVLSEKLLSIGPNCVEAPQFYY